MAMDRKRCIFCQHIRKMTDEHIWGEWIQAYVPATSNKHDLSNVRMKKPGEPAAVQIRMRAGDSLNARVRVVCGACNSGWMSQIQERAKPFLIPLFDGTPCTIETSAQAILSSWIAMATMTGEYISRDDKKVAVSQADRDWLTKTQTAPAGWRIWIGRYERGPRRGQWSHASHYLSEAENLCDIIPVDDRLPNTQTTAFQIGKLFVLAMSSAFPEIPKGWNWRNAKRARSCLEQIWPETGGAIFWPPPVMTDNDAEAFSTAFARFHEELALRLGYR